MLSQECRLLPRTGQIVTEYCCYAMSQLGMHESQNVAQDVNPFTQSDVQSGNSSRILQSPIPALLNKNSSDQMPSKGERSWPKHKQSEYNLKRTWNPISSTSDRGMELTVMSYNILSQKLLAEHSFLYTQSKRWHLEWDVRCTALCHEIRNHDSDIICVQEVEEMDWMMDIFPFFNFHGYVGIYKKRTGNKSDGCAILFKRSKFTLLRSVPVEYCQGGVLDRDNIGLIVVLQPNRPYYKGDAQKICVATTHLLFNPRRGDVKLAQLMLLLAELDKHAAVDVFATQKPVFASDYPKSCKRDFARSETFGGSRGSHPYCPTILCGDFNMEPMSELYRFVTEGYIHYSKCISKALSGQREGQDSSSYLTYIPCNLLPQHLHITDKCQYAKGNRMRHVQPQKSPDGDLVQGMMNRSPSPLQNPVQSINTASPSAETSYMPLNTSGQKVNVEQPSTGTECFDGSSLQNNPTDQPASSMSPLTHDNKVSIDRSNYEKNAFNTGQASHSFNFRSAYRHWILDKDDYSGEVSSWHSKACCTLDYIFYSSGMLPVKSQAAKHSADSSSKKGRRRSPRRKIREDYESDESPNQKRKGKSSGRHKSKRSKLGSLNTSAKETDCDRVGRGSNTEPVIVIDMESEDEKGHESDRLSDSLKSPNQKNVSGKSEYQERLQLLSHFSLFTYPDVLSSKPIPNAECASDHYCLIAKFLLR